MYYRPANLEKHRHVIPPEVLVSPAPQPAETHLPIRTLLKTT